MRQTGFTLIELLVVVAILALLIVAFPSILMENSELAGKSNADGIADEQAALISIGLFLASQSRLVPVEGRSDFGVPHDLSVSPFHPAARLALGGRRSLSRRGEETPNVLAPDDCGPQGRGSPELLVLPLVCMFAFRKWPSRNQREQSEQFIRQTFEYVDRFPVPADNHKAALMKLRIQMLLVQYEEKLAARRRWKC